MCFVSLKNHHDRHHSWTLNGQACNNYLFHESNKHVVTTIGYSTSKTSHINFNSMRLKLSQKKSLIYGFQKIELKW